MKRHSVESRFAYIARCVWLVMLLGSPVWFSALDTWVSSLAQYQEMGWYHDFSEGYVVFWGAFCSSITWFSASPMLLFGFWLMWHRFSVLNIIAQVLLFGAFYLLPSLLLGF